MGRQAISRHIILVVVVMWWGGGKGYGNVSRESQVLGTSLTRIKGGGELSSSF